MEGFYDPGFGEGNSRKTNHKPDAKTPCLFEKIMMAFVF